MADPTPRDMHDAIQATIAAAISAAECAAYVIDLDAVAQDAADAADHARDAAERSERGVSDAEGEFVAAEEALAEAREAAQEAEAAYAVAREAERAAGAAYAEAMRAGEGNTALEDASGYAEMAAQAAFAVNDAAVAAFRQAEAELADAERRRDAALHRHNLASLAASRAAQAAEAGLVSDVEEAVIKAFDEHVELQRVRAQAAELISIVVGAHASHYIESLDATIRNVTSAAFARRPVYVPPPAVDEASAAPSVTPGPPAELSPEQAARAAACAAYVGSLRGLALAAETVADRGPTTWDGELEHAVELAEARRREFVEAHRAALVAHLRRVVPLAQ